MRIDGASIAIAKGSTVDPATVRRLTFDGKATAIVAPGTPLISDVVELAVDAMDDLVGSIYVDQPISPAPMGGATMLVSPSNDIALEHPTEGRWITSRPIVTAVLVKPKRATRVVVAVGDSITDGVRDKPSEVHGWVAVLAINGLLRKRSRWRPFRPESAAIGY